MVHFFAPRKDSMNTNQSSTQSSKLSSILLGAVVAMILAYLVSIRMFLTSTRDGNNGSAVVKMTATGFPTVCGDVEKLRFLPPGDAGHGGAEVTLVGGLGPSTFVGPFHGVDAVPRGKFKFTILPEGGTHVEAVAYCTTPQEKQSF